MQAEQDARRVRDVAAASEPRHLEGSDHDCPTGSGHLGRHVIQPVDPMHCDALGCRSREARSPVSTPGRSPCGATRYDGSAKGCGAQPKTTSKNPERHRIRTRLDSFYQQAAATDAPEAHRLAATVGAWWPAIEAGILTGYSNSRSEGYNRLAKHQGRNAFGFRNPVNQRRRIRWSCTRQHGRASAARSTLPA